VPRLADVCELPERIAREARTQISADISHIGAAEDAALR
jgi:hypothetical protein